MERQQDGPKGHGCRPLVPEDIQADGSGHRRDVGVPYLGHEPDLGRVEGVRAWDLDLQLEGAPLVGRVGRASNRPGQLCK